MNNITAVGDGGTILRTTNGGINWISQSSGTTENFRGVSFTDVNNGTVVGDYGTILRTNNGGGVFIPVELSLFTADVSGSNINLNWSTASEINNYGFEIERSSDKTDWRLIGFKEGNGTTTEIHNYSFVDDLFGTSSSKLYYRLKQIDFNASFEYSDIVEIEIAPATFSLSQNYPNPFNPTTNIGFRIAEFGFVSLKVFDVLGIEVAILVNEEKQPGIYEVEFDASHLSSGIYFYKLQTENLSENKKKQDIKRK